MSASRWFVGMGGINDTSGAKAGRDGSGGDC
jgi:hypothetical protein